MIDYRKKYESLLEILEIHAHFLEMFVEGEISNKDLSFGIKRFIQAVDKEVLINEGETL